MIAVRRSAREQYAQSSSSAAVAAAATAYGADKSSTSTTKRSKRVRRESTSSITIEELASHDQGYEADVEVIRPDYYEENESDIDAGASETPKRRFRDEDEELAARMQQLGNDESSTDSPHTPVTMSGRKRRSLHKESSTHRSGRYSAIEITEMVDDDAQEDPPFKRRRKNRLSNLATRSSADTPQSTTASTPDREQTSTTDVQDLMDMT